MPSPRRASRPNTTALAAFASVAAYSAIALQSKEKNQEEAATVSIIDVRCGNDVRDTGQRETQVDNAEYDRSPARGARVLHSNPTRIRAAMRHSPMRVQRQAPDLLQVLPGVSVVPHQCDDAEQHRRRAKDNPPIQRRLHREKATPSLLRACGTSEVISALSFCSVSEKRGMHEFAYLSMGDLRIKPGSTPSAASQS